MDTEVMTECPLRGHPNVDFQIFEYHTCHFMISIFIGNETLSFQLYR